MKVIAGAIGNCIHVVGVRNFLQLAEQEGLAPVYLGARISPQGFVQATVEHDPEVVGVSYRLSEETCLALLSELKERLTSEGLLEGRIFLFGGTTATGEVARNNGLFREVFDGSQSREEVAAFVRALRGGAVPHDERTIPPQELVERIAAKTPLPLIRHHLGLPTVGATVQAAAQLADSRLLDVISIAPDQTAQEAFFRPEEQEGRPTGAGGVPVRQPGDLEAIYAATRRGNHPLCRCYSGTQDVLRWAELLVKTIHNGWCAVPLSWYGELDRRGPRPLAQSIPEAQALMRWHAEREIPVEVNEAHQWSLRRASDAIAVATAYLAAYNAKQMGVRHYVAQYMLNTPAGISPTKDLAKALAKIELIEGLHDDGFVSFREVRPGLLSFPSNPEAARGQLAFSTVLALHLQPHILHIVAYTEGRTAAGATEIIRSVRLAAQVVEQFRLGMPVEAALADPSIQDHKKWLLGEAGAIIEAIRELGRECDDPLTAPANLIRAIQLGIFDAPDLQGVPAARGDLATSIVDGACVAVDAKSGQSISEASRVTRILKTEGIR